MWSRVLSQGSLSGRSLVQLLVAIFLISTFVGCPSSTKPVTPKQTTKSAKEIENNCENSLNSALGMLKPEQLGVFSDPKDAVTVLNEWLSNCGSTDELESPLTDEVKKQLKSLVSQKMFEEISNDRFSVRDGLHIRDCTISKRLIERAQKNSPDDLQTIVALFYSIVRNIEILDERIEKIPLSPFERLMCGYGRAEDRALVFAELLRQLRIDVVILSQAGTEKKKSDQLDKQNNSEDESSTQPEAWLVGVLLDGKVFLFDMQSGLPIPANVESLDTVLPQRPATLSELKANPKLLQVFDLDNDHAYSEQFQNLNSWRVELVSHASFSKPVNFFLQDSLLGDRSVIIYDSLLDGQFGKGQISRIAKAGQQHWKPEDLSIWPYPEQELVSAQNPSQKQKIARQNILLVLEAPFMTIIIPSNTIPPLEGAEPLTAEQKKLQAGTLGIAGMEKRRLLYKSRVRQMVGKSALAIQSYQGVRQHIINQKTKIEDKLAQAPLRKPDVPQLQAIFFENNKAASTAHFWTATCHLDEHDYKTAAGTLANYFKRPRQAHVNHGNYLLAIAYAETEKFAAAISRLKNVKPNHANWRSAQFLLARFRRMRSQNEANTTARQPNSKIFARTTTSLNPNR